MELIIRMQREGITDEEVIDADIQAFDFNDSEPLIDAIDSVIQERLQRGWV
jgi:hypothetical protein